MKNQKNDKDYLSKSEFARKAMISRKTIDRLAAKLMKENPSTTKIIKTKNGSCKIHRCLLKKYVNEEYLAQERQIKRLKNTVDCIRDRKRLGYKLHNDEWSIFGGISYANETSRDKCRENMIELYRELVKNNQLKSQIRFFFTTEDIYGEGNVHNHFVLYLSQPEDVELAQNIITKLFKKDKIHIEKYDYYQAGIFYIAKEGLRSTHWDVIGSDLFSDDIL
jgi:hypothetical protein